VPDTIDNMTGKLAAIAVGQVPILSVVVEAAKAFLPEGADGRLKEAVAVDFRDKVARLEARVEQLAKELEAVGLRLEELGAVRTVAVVRAFAEAVGAAQSDEKVDALISAAARQFDPRRGPESARAYWLARAGALADIEVRAILLLSQHDKVLLADGAIVAAPHNPDVSRPPERQRLDLPVEEALALTEAIKGLVDAGSSLINASTPTMRSTSLYSLTRSGLVLARFIT
jgi:hypothetical protein